MKQLAEALRSRLKLLYKQIVGGTAISRIGKTNRADLAENKEFLEEPTAQPQKPLEEQIRSKGILKKIAQKLLLKKSQHRAVKNSSIQSLFVS